MQELIDNIVNSSPSENEGIVIFDVKAYPQDIVYPTDLTLLLVAREKSEELIEMVFGMKWDIDKPRT